MHQCEHCSFETRHKGSLHRHLRIHSKETHFTCRRCFLETRCKECFLSHMILHKKEPIASKCEKHIRGPSRDGIVPSNNYLEMPKCGHCSSETKCESTVSNQVIKRKVMHDDSPKVYKCNRCPFKTTGLGLLQQHMVGHPKKPIMYKCTKCPFETNDNRVLGEHMPSHTANKKIITYKCRHCRFQTIKKSLLLKHFRSHNNLAVSNYP